MRFVTPLAFLASAIFSASVKAQEPLPIRAASEIRNLQDSAFSVQRSALLEGVVVLEARAEEFPTLFLQDHSATMMVTGNKSLIGRHSRGTRVRVKGEIREGNFAPFVFAEQIESLGAAEIPAALPVSIDELQTGSQAQQWVALRGVVRRTDPMPPKSDEPWRFDLSTGGSRITVLLRGKDAAPPPVDSEVLVEGICFTQFTSNRQILNPRIVVPAGCTPKILQPAPVAPPERPLNQVMAFRPDSSNAHRAKVRGTVTHASPNGIWIQSDSAALRVLPISPISARPGTTLEAIGFARRDGTSFVLEDAVCKAGSEGQPPAPVPVESLADASLMDGRLLVLEGTLNHLGPAPDGGHLLLLENASGPFKVRLPAQEKPSPNWRPGARLETRGICILQSAETPLQESRPDSASQISRRELIGPLIPGDFQILARNGNDIRILRPPPFWSAGRLIAAVAGVALLLAGLLVATVAASKRRLRAAATATRLAEAESAAVWSERTRIARELHDTLAQDFASLKLHLELLRNHVPSDSKPGEYLAQAGSIVRQSLTEIRDAIWMLRGDALRQSGLPAAMEGLMERLCSRASISFSFTMDGLPVNLPPVTEHHLLRITKECAQNALKHASPSQLRVHLSYRTDSAGLCIEDNGCGFDSVSAQTSNGFGLRGLEERVQEIHGTLEIHSEIGKGTRVQIHLPLP